MLRASLVAQWKESACQSWIPGSGGTLGERNGNPLQYSCLRNPMDRGVLEGYSPWGCKSWTRLSAHTHTHNKRRIYIHFKVAYN